MCFFFDDIAGWRAWSRVGQPQRSAGIGLLFGGVAVLTQLPDDGSLSRSVIGQHVVAPFECGGCIVNNVLSGWEPTEEDIRHVCLAAAGPISTDEMLERGLARYRRDHRQNLTPPSKQTRL
jgi:hypothetical protein